MDLTKITPIQKARAVFDAIDLDASGKVENFELKELLTWWGCPESELDSYMKGFDADGDGEISFDDEFYPEMQEIWRFGWDHVRASLAGRAHSARSARITLQPLLTPAPSCISLRRCSSPRSIS